MASLVVFHTNDFHNHFPEREMREVLSHEKGVKPGHPTLLVDSGDAIAGSNTLFFWNEPVLAKMREMGYDAMAMGNRELHYVRPILARRVTQMGFPLLCANVEQASNSRKRTPCTSSEFLVRPYHLVEKSGIRVGLFGLTVCQYPEGSLWEMVTGLRFLDPVESARRMVRELLDRRADLIICLSHHGLSQDKEIAGSVEGIDLILGGHSHSVMTSLERVGRTSIGQAGFWGKYLGKVEVTLSRENGKRRIEASGSLVRLKEGKRDDPGPVHAVSQ